MYYRIIRQYLDCLCSCAVHGCIICGSDREQLRKKDLEADGHVRVFGENAPFLHGQDETILPCLAMGGAQGGIGGTTNYNGKELTGILEAWAAGDLETARERQNFSQEVINVICNYRGNIVGGKRIMKLIGLDLGKNRTPFRNMTDEEEAAMKAELEAINFFERCNKF